LLTAKINNKINTTINDKINVTFYRDQLLIPYDTKNLLEDYIIL